MNFLMPIKIMYSPVTFMIIRKYVQFRDLLLGAELTQLHGVVTFAICTVEIGKYGRLLKPEMPVKHGLLNIEY